MSFDLCMKNARAIAQVIIANASILLKGLVIMKKTCILIVCYEQKYVIHLDVT